MGLKSYYTDEVIPFKSKKYFTILWHIPNQRDEAILAVYELAHFDNFYLFDKYEGLND